MTFQPDQQISFKSWFQLLKKHANEFAWILSGVILFGFGVENVFYGAKSISWPSAEGVVQTSKIVEYKVKRRNRKRFRWEFDYSYIHDGTQYTSSRVSFGKSSLSNSRKDLASKYHIGKRVRVYLNPENPQVAVLERGITDGSLMFLLSSFACVTWGIGSLIFQKHFFRIGLTLSTVICMHLVSQLYINPSQTRERMQNLEEAEIKRHNQRSLEEYNQKIRLDQLQLSGKFLISKRHLSSFEFRKDETGDFFCGLMLQFGKDSFVIPFTYKQNGDLLEIIQSDNGAKVSAKLEVLYGGKIYIENVIAEEGMNRYLIDLLDEGQFLRTEKSLGELADE